MKKKLIPKSVFSKFSLTLVSIITASFLLLVIIVDIVIGNYYVDIRKKELSRLALSCGELVKIDYYLYVGESGDSEELISIKNMDIRARISALSNDTDMFLLLVGSDGAVSSFDDSVVALEGVYLYPEINEKIMKTGVSSGVSDCGVFSSQHYYHAIRLTNQKGEHIATVMACIPEPLVKAPVSAIMQMIVMVCLGVLLAAVLVAYFISKRLTRPLYDMSRAAKAFSDGDFTVRVPVKKGEDEISEFAKVFNDMADNLENMEKTRNDFVANVSHDLRSPMTSINGFIEGMISGVIPPEKHDHYLRIVLGETKRLSRLVATLLDISRIQAGERKFRMMNFDICELARQIIISFENRIEEKNLDVNFESDEDRIYVRADMDAIYQVLYNLCDNATKFAYDGKKFQVTVRDKGENVAVQVLNEGDGISKEDIKYIFDRFYKGDKSRGMDKTGTGLGLYISKKIIEAHKQSINAESEYGAWCSFTFTLEKGARPIKGRGAEGGMNLSIDK